MDLYEYQGKELFNRVGIPVSEGRLATTPEEARKAAEEIGGPVVVKAQVLTGGRGKAGGVKLADDPADAEAMIDEVRSDLQLAIAELRALAHGIFPPLLMSGGLAEALPAAANRAALATRTELDVERHSPELEAAVYFCCMEALQNAGKHAGADASAIVKVWQGGGELHWEVSDDGPGFDVGGAAGSGHGFVNMRDRMGALGGTVDIISRIGAGTTIRGSLPLDQVP